MCKFHEKILARSRRPLLLTFACLMRFSNHSIDDDESFWRSSAGGSLGLSNNQDRFGGGIYMFLCVSVCIVNCSRLYSQSRVYLFSFILYNNLNMHFLLFKMVYRNMSIASALKTKK